METSRALAASLRRGRPRRRRGEPVVNPTAEASEDAAPFTAEPVATEAVGSTIPDSVDTVLALVRRHPGLTCEEIAGTAEMDTVQVKPILAVLVARRFLVKTGRTRGTRYWPPPDARNHA